MADTLTPHLNKQKQHIMISSAIMADWFDLVQGAVDLFSFMPIWMCVTASMRITSERAHVHVCVCQSLSKQIEAVWAREPEALLVL